MTLRRIDFIPIPAGAAPGFDHADVYRAGRRLYVAHTGADRVDVLDCENLTYLRSLPGLSGVAGVLIDEPHDRLFTSDRGAARVSIFRCSDEELLGQVAVGAHPNGLAYDPARRRLYSFNLGNPLGVDCSASVVDIATLHVVATIPLAGRPRWAVYDGDRDTIYANVRDPAEIAVIDCARATITRTLPIPSAGPHGLWLDGDRLFCAADGGDLVVLDRDSGAILASLPLPGVPDVLMHDARLRRLYVAVGDPGVVCSFDSDRLEHVETVATEEGAHTIGWDPFGQNLYAFCPTSGGAAIYTER